MDDIIIKLSLTTRSSHTKQQLKEISYVLNECCSQLENLKCDVTYKMLVNGDKYIAPID